ncbi:hypothetical protein [Streptomyces sp. NPDC126499]|uniref:hypothetical protein n=1 Tax=Streptomyces sp. NPDC126499 TaxID=3155314 RepID=UPI003329926D
MSLAGLGLSGDQERLYRYLLRRPHADPTRIRIELAMPDLPRVIGELRARGLVDHASAPVAAPVTVDRPGRGRDGDARPGARRAPRRSRMAALLARVAAARPRGALLRTFRSPVADVERH